MLRYILLLLLTIGCTACGLKGPLHLPDKAGAVVVNPAASSSSSSSSVSSAPVTEPAP